MLSYLKYILLFQIVFSFTYSFSQPKAVFKKYDSSLNALFEAYKMLKSIKDSGYLPNHIKYKKAYYYDRYRCLKMAVYLKGDVAKSKGSYEFYYYDNNKPTMATRMDLNSMKENRFYFFDNKVYLSRKVATREDYKVNINDPNIHPLEPRYQYVRVHDPILKMANELLQEFLAIKSHQ